MHRYGGLPEFVSFGILLLFSLYLGLYFALFGACFALVRRWKGTVAALALSPVLWVAVELARARITGFPWDLLGYTQIDNHLLTPLAPWTGVFGLSFIVAVGNALWFWRPASPSPQGRAMHWAGPALATCLILASLAGQHYQSPAVPFANTAILVQDNLLVGQEAQGEQESQAALLASLAAVTAKPAISQPLLTPSTAASAKPEKVHAPDLVVWPEAPSSFQSADPAFREVMAQVARRAGAPVVVDAVALDRHIGDNREGSGGGQIPLDEFVSASFFLPDGTYAGRYDKMHLVPFGEYTPYKSLFFFAGHLLDQLTFVPGTERRLFSVAGRRFGVFLCYESIFGDEVREFARSGAQVLVNLTDDGWYGDSSAPWEHLDMARMRALENRRWLLRATNTGVTASIDPDGRLVATMPRHLRGAVQVPFAFRGDLTFYTRHGDWLAWLCALTTIAVLIGGPLQVRYPVSPAFRETLPAATSTRKPVN